VSHTQGRLLSHSCSYSNNKISHRMAEESRRPSWFASWWRATPTYAASWYKQTLATYSSLVSSKITPG